jgi:hypothetical protein
MIEDAVNRFDSEVDRPRRATNTNDNEQEVLIAHGVKGMLAKGPDLRIEIKAMSESEYVIKARVSKGNKKNVFNDEILISNLNAQKLKQYIKDNFMFNEPTTNNK